MAKQQKKKKASPKKKKTTKKKPADPFAHLTWDELEEWAGATIVSRGRNYQRRGAVHDLALTADGALLAWVFGTQRYITQVSIHRKKLESECTCPYWTACKHAVAVVLSYLECLKEKTPVEKAEEGDPRLGMLKDYDEFAEDFDADDEDWDEDDEDWDETPPAKTSQKKPSPLRDYLQEHTRAELVSLLEEVAGDYPEIRQQLEDRQTLFSGPGRQRAHHRAPRQPAPHLYRLPPPAQIRRRWALRLVDGLFTSA